MKMYLARCEKPFSMDPETLERHTLPPTYITFQEAVINLLIHQDYAYHGRKPVIRSFDDRASLWNPGNAFVSDDKLLKSGEKDVQDPKTVTDFRRIDLSEQAGTGPRAFFSQWTQLGFVPPMVNNDRTKNSFKINLLKQPLLTDSRVLSLARSGLDVDMDEARILALACRTGKLYHSDVGTVTGAIGAETQDSLDRLESKSMITPLEDSKTPTYIVSEQVKHFLEHPEHQIEQRTSRASIPVSRQVYGHQGKLVSDSVTDPAGTFWGLNDVESEIVESCNSPRSFSEIARQLNFADRILLRRNYLASLLNRRILRMTYPDKPTHPNQAYVLTYLITHKTQPRLGGGKAWAGCARRRGAGGGPAPPGRSGG